MSSDEDGIQLSTIVRQPRRFYPAVARKPYAVAVCETDQLMADDMPPPYPLTANVSRNGASHSSHSPNPSSSASVRSAGITDVGVTLTPLAITAVSPRPSASSTAVRMPQPPPPPPPERQEHAVDENEETDEEVLNVLGDPSGFFFKDRDLVVPSKSQVLLYFATATNFKLRRTGGGELQVTDASDYPLFDVWIEMDCCRCTWVLEAYGKTVLLMHEKTGSSYCSRRPRNATRVPPITITDWNGDLFGHLTPGLFTHVPVSESQLTTSSGDPFLLQSGEKATVAKLVPHGASETTPSDDPEAGTTADACEKRLCWMCVLEGSGRHIARLEGFDDILFNKDVAFQLKLLTLAGIIRLSAPWNMPGRGDNRHAMSGCWRVVSSLLNCCAYCLY